MERYNDTERFSKIFSPSGADKTSFRSPILFNDGENILKVTLRIKTNMNEYYGFDYFAIEGPITF